MKLVILVLISCSVVAGQSSSDLQKKYGRARLEPVYYWLGAGKLDETDTFMTMSVVTEIFDELVPTQKRGWRVSGPSEGHVEWIYKNVSLLIDGQTDKARRAVIAFNDAQCKGR